ncbi:hypothetical protein CS542_05625 [Pedobacter sp. IW39]|nr:hypothetical protein CS542_05625 [Pedobacter sp. IW39]
MFPSRFNVHRDFFNQDNQITRNTTVRGCITFPLMLNYTITTSRMLIVIVSSTNCSFTMTRAF